MYFGMFLQLMTTMVYNNNGFDQAAGGLDQ